MRNRIGFLMSWSVVGFLVGSLPALFLLALFLSSPPKATAAGNGCVPTTDPGACDDGLGPTVCTKMKASTVHHLTVTGSQFAKTGVCVYTTNQTGTLKGDVVLQSGAGGTAPIPIFTPGWAAAGLRNSAFAWDSMWEQVGNAFPGNLKAAAGKMEAALDWVNANIRGASAPTPYCAWAGSAGSSAMLYALTQYGEGDSKLDHVQVQAATPYARIDVLCNPNVGPLATTMCPAVNNIAPNFVPGPRAFLHNDSCMTSSVTQQELDAWQAMSIVSSTEQTSFGKTTLSAFYCQNQPNFTVAQGAYFLGTQNTNININVPVDFLNPDGTVYCPANTPCHPFLYCAPTTSTCVGEIAFGDPKVRALESADMIRNCVNKHNPAAEPKP